MASDRKTGVLSDGTIVGYANREDVTTELHLYDEGTTVVLALVATDGSKRWEQPLEIEELDDTIAAMKRLRDLVAKRKYGRD